METVRLDRLMIRLMIAELLTLVCFYWVWIGGGALRAGSGQSIIGFGDNRGGMGYLR